MTFRIVIDSREQKPFAFPCPSIVRALRAGDYSVDGFESRVAVERKSLADFAKSAIHDRERFGRELELLAGFQAACVAVEGDLDRTLRGEASEIRGVSGASLLGAAVDIGLRYGVPVHWCGSRQAACAFTERFLRQFVVLHPEVTP